LSKDERERANLVKREVAQLETMREKFAAWERAIPPIPEDAAYFIPYSRADLAHPS